MCFPKMDYFSVIDLFVNVLIDFMHFPASSDCPPPANHKNK